jgi:hypothetical protein
MLAVRGVHDAGVHGPHVLLTSVVESSKMA